MARFAPEEQYVYSKGYPLIPCKPKKVLCRRFIVFDGCYCLNRGLLRMIQMTRILRIVSINCL